jgi:hypothetical protein
MTDTPFLPLEAWPMRNHADQAMHGIQDDGNMTRVASRPCNVETLPDTHGLCTHPSLPLLRNPRPDCSSCNRRKPFLTKAPSPSHQRAMLGWYDPSRHASTDTTGMSSWRLVRDSHEFKRMHTFTQCITMHQVHKRSAVAYGTTETFNMAWQFPVDEVPHRGLQSKRSDLRDYNILQ